MKIFWYDGLAQTPEVPSVPKGELLGDLPFVRPKGQQGSSAGAQRQMRPRNTTGFVGRVFDYEKYQAARNDSEAVIPKPNGSVFIGSKGCSLRELMVSRLVCSRRTRSQDYRFPRRC